MSNKVSIKKISELSGFSTATVSRVINQNGRYTKETEKKILSIIKQYDYVPNMIAKGLRTNQLQTIGIIVPDITNEFFSRLTLSAQNALFQSSYSAFICNTNERHSMEKRHLELMRAQNISGIIFICSETVYGEVYRSIPKVYVDRVPLNLPDSETYYFIESDNYQGGYLAMKELIGAGCKKIISIFEKRDISPKIARFKGVIAALNDYNIPIDEKMFKYAERVTYFDAYDIVNSIIDSKIEFDGLFCYTDIIAMGAINALNNRGISVPKDVKIIGFDDISLAKYNTPSISTISQPVDLMGALAAKIMLKILKKEPIEQTKYVLPVALIKRETT